MTKRPLNISEEAAVQMPMKTVASLIIIVALGTMGYFQMVERLNQHSTRLELMEKDLTENTDFRIKWPRGQLGSLPADSAHVLRLIYLMLFYSFIFGFGSGIIISFSSYFNGEWSTGLTKKASKQNKSISIAVNP